MYVYGNQRILRECKPQYFNIIKPDGYGIREDSANGWQPTNVGINMSLEAKLQLSSKTKTPNPEDHLARLFKRKNEVILEVQGTLEVLKGLMTRVKTDEVKDNVNKLTPLFDVLVNSRNDIKAECRTMVAEERTRVDSLAVDTKTLDRVAATEMKILDDLDAVNKWLDDSPRSSLPGQRRRMTDPKIRPYYSTEDG